MFKALKTLNAKSKTVASAALLIGAASMASRFAGIVRDRILSGTFGAGSQLDAYYAAFRAPDFIYNLFVIGALTAGFIPVFSRYLTAEGESPKDTKPAWAFVSRLLTVLGVILAGLSVLGILTAPFFVPWMTPGFSGEQTVLTVKLTRIMFLSPIFLGLSAVFGGVLQSYRRFIVYSFAPIIYNLGIIFGAVFLSHSFGVAGVAVGVVIGAAGHYFIQHWACRGLGFRFRPRLDFRDEGVRTIGWMMLPRTAGLAVSQVNLLILTGMASTLGVGSIAVFNLANNLQSFPINILGVSFAVAAFPFISELADKGLKREMAVSFAKTVRLILFLILPATVLFLLLRAQIVRVILGSGRFDWQDTVTTADTLACFTLSLFAQALLPLVTRVFFAFKDVKTPLLVGVAAVVVERLLAWLFVSHGLGAAGLALAFSAASVFNLALLWLLLRLRSGDLGEKGIFRAAALLSLCATAMAAAVQGAKIVLGNLVDMHTFFGVFSQAAVAAVAGVAVYLLLAFWFGSEEARTIMNYLRRRAALVGVRQEGESLQAD